MHVSPGMQVRVIASYQAPYPDPIIVLKGEEVSIDRTRETDIPGWVWCTGRSGKSGWVPETYLEQHGDQGIMCCDYNAIELTIHPGERLTVHKVESGFVWVTDQSGQTGWVPSTHVDAC